MTPVYLGQLAANWLSSGLRSSCSTTAASRWTISGAILQSHGCNPSKRSKIDREESQGAYGTRVVDSQPMLRRLQHHSCHLRLCEISRAPSLALTNHASSWRNQHRLTSIKLSAPASSGNQRVRRWSPPCWDMHGRSACNLSTASQPLKSSQVKLFSRPKKSWRLARLKLAIFADL